MNRSLFFIVLFFVSGCATGWRPTEAALKGLPLTQNDFVHYAETACNGPCYVFDVYIFSNGDIIYRGFEPVTTPQVTPRTGNHFVGNNFDLYLDLQEKLSNERLVDGYTDLGWRDFSRCRPFQTDASGIVVERIFDNKRDILIWNRGCRGLSEEGEIVSLVNDLRAMLSVEELTVLREDEKLEK